MASISLMCSMDEMMKGEKGWRELQILGEENSKFDSHGNGHGSSNARESDERDTSNTKQIESNDDNWTAEEV
jgi:hypothetical protein